MPDPIDPASAMDGADGGALALLDWRRQVASLYAMVRATADAPTGWRLWREGRDRLFASHPQSALAGEERHAFKGLPFRPYDPALRFAVTVRPLDGEETGFAAGADGVVRMRPIGRTEGLGERLGAELTLFWLLGYGGGVFLPFADATSRQDTYGGGRYLLDTIKGADLGSTADGALILDFNFAYNPSCAYSPRFVCPLAPPTNRLPLPVLAGEGAPH